jgi:xanthine dehydrogenase molybdopterin-binding subunit B
MEPQVELDMLTGEHVILRTDLCYDVPRSVNPVIVIDLGQARPPAGRPPLVMGRGRARHC